MNLLVIDANRVNFAMSKPAGGCVARLEFRCRDNYYHADRSLRAVRNDVYGALRKWFGDHGFKFEFQGALIVEFNLPKATPLYGWYDSHNQLLYISCKPKSYFDRFFSACFLNEIDKPCETFNIAPDMPYDYRLLPHMRSEIKGYVPRTVFNNTGSDRIDLGLPSWVKIMAAPSEKEQIVQKAKDAITAMIASDDLSVEEIKIDITAKLVQPVQQINLTTTVKV